MAGCSPGKTSSYPVEMVLQEHAKYVVFIKELQTQVRTLQDFRSRVLQAFPHLDIGLYCSMAMSKLTSKRFLKSGSETKKNCLRSATPNNILPVLPGLAEYTDVSGQFQMKQVKHLQKKNICLHTQPRKLGERNLGNSFRSKTKRIRSSCRGKKCTEFGSSNHARDDEVEDDCDMSNETSTCTSNSFHSMTNQRNIKSKCVKKKTVGSTCLAHRQDSGFSTDGKDKAAISHPEEIETPHSSNMEKEDELMNILEIIEQRSVTMRSLVENGTSHRESEATDKHLDKEELETEVDRLQFEKEILVEKLLSMEVDHKLYKEEINRLKDSLIEAEVSKRVLEERLEAAISEREQLGTRINRLHTKFVNKNATVSYGQTNDSSIAIRDATKLFPGVDSPNSCLDGTTSLPDRFGRPVSKLKVRMDKSKVSAILKESRTLELQRQLLVSVIRNEVVKCRVEHQEKEWKQRLAKWQQLEIQLQRDVEALKRVNSDLQTKAQKVTTDLRMERTKRKVLERALHAAYRDLTNANNCTEIFDVGVNVDYSKDVLYNCKQKHNLLKNGTVNDFRVQKLPTENDSRSRGYKFTKAEELVESDSEVLPSFTQFEDPTLSSKRCISTFKRQTIDTVSPNLKDSTAHQLDYVEGAQMLKVNSFNYVPICNHTTSDKLTPQWKWSYRIHPIPDETLS